MFEPDVIVQASDRPTVELIAGVTSVEARAADDASHLKRYMRGMGCHLGLLVTPVKMAVFSDERASSPDWPIAEVASVSTEALFGHRLQAGGEKAFAVVVQRWLEGLAAIGKGSLPTSDEARRVIDTYILPAVAGGRVAAGGYR